MHYHHAPHTDDDPPTMPASMAGFMPNQRTPADNQIFDEATTEVPVIKPFRADSASPDIVDRAAETETPAEAETGAEPAAAEPEGAAELAEETPEAEPAEPEGAAAEPETDNGTDTAADDPAAPSDGEAGDQTTAEAVDAQAPLAHAPWADLATPAPAAQDTEATGEPEATAESAEADAVEAPSDEAAQPAREPAAVAEDDELDEPEGEETAEAGDEPTATAAPQVESAEVGAEPAATDDEGTTVQATLEQTETGAPTAVPGRPGEVAQERIAVWSEEEAQRLRTEWRELQVQFIDEPAAAVAGAKRLVTEAVEQLSQSLLSQRDLLEPQSEHPDTEALRVAMRRYREFLDRVLAL